MNRKKILKFASLQFIEQIFREPRFLSLCRNVTAGSDLADDLLQHCAIRIYEKGFIAADEKNGNLYAYFKRIAVTEWLHPSSKFNQVYRNRKMPTVESIEIIDSDDEDDEFEKIGKLQSRFLASSSQTPSNEFREWLSQRLDRKESSERDYFLQQIFIAYLRLGSIREVSEATGICKTYVASAIKTYKTQIENEYRNSDHD